MKLKSEVIGGVVTGLYLVLVLTLVYLRRDTLPGLGLNEVGDFLAGVFGPVAFLWLVLGYLQQGRELKLSSEALLLQAAELKSSVEQQTHLVAVGREQIIAQAEALSQERQRYERSMNAHIILYPGKYLVSGTCVTQEFEVYNAGADVFDLLFMCRIPSNNLHAELDVLKKDKTANVQFNFDLVDKDYLEILHCFYKTLDGRQIYFTMDLVINTESQRIAITPRIRAEDL